MNAATTVAITSSAAASGSAAIAARQAREARLQACKAFEYTYDPKLAQVEQKQEYGACMKILYPEPSEPMTVSEVFAVKGVVLVLLVSMVIGLIKGYQDDGLADSVLLGIVYPSCAAVVIFALALAALGIQFIFS